MNSGLYEVPGFSATWIAAARASWLALPVTKLSNENVRFRRARSRIVGTSLAPRCAGCGARAAASAPRARTRRTRPDPGIELLRGELLLESTQAGVPEVLHLVVGRVSSNFTFFGMSYPQPRARAAGKRNDLTMH